MNAFRSLSLVAATITMGLTAGTFDLYAHTVMPGLKKTGDRTFVAAFTAIDRSILNPWFIAGCFLSALAFTICAALTHLGQAALPWIVSALVLYLAAFVITFAVHLPLNDAIKAAGADHASDSTAIREQFGEARWAAWNLVRAVTSTLGFGCLTWALVLSGRAGT
jgi:uncharacterized membrane protein